MMLAVQGFTIARRDVTKPGLVFVLTCMITQYFVVFIFMFFPPGLNMGTVAFLICSIAMPITLGYFYFDTHFRLKALRS